MFKDVKNVLNEILKIFVIASEVFKYFPRVILKYKYLIVIAF